MRLIEDDDIEAAARGLNMRSLRLTDDELAQLVEKHEKITMFASQVIAAAARRILAERNTTNYQ